MQTDLSAALRRFLVDIAWSLAIISLGLGVLYAIASDSLSLAQYLVSLGEVLLAPLYPGALLYYPLAGAVALGAVLWFSYKLPMRSVRLPLIFGATFFWFGLGLLTVVRYYQ